MKRQNYECGCPALLSTGLAMVFVFFAFGACAAAGSPDASDVAAGTPDAWEPATDSAGIEDVGLDPVPPVDITRLLDVAALDVASLFTFVVFSDNKGGAPDTLESMAGVATAVLDMDAEFALGLGDHVKSGDHAEQAFVPFVTSEPWWFRNFYPNIADGENTYYGSGQGDWGAGAGLVDDLMLCGRPGVVCRDNHAEYHAVIPVGDIAVHFVSVHYPDSGDDPFPKASQDYLLAELDGIARTGTEIVIVAAHTGNWLRDLSLEDREQVLAQADLLLGATTHFFERYDYPDDQALFLNTGSAGYSLFNNYLQINVFDEPLRLVVQNMEAESDRVLQAGGNCLIKEIGGPITPCAFENGYSWGVFGSD